MRKASKKEEKVKFSDELGRCAVFCAKTTGYMIRCRREARGSSSEQCGVRYEVVLRTLRFELPAPRS